MTAIQIPTDESPHVLVPTGISIERNIDRIDRVLVGTLSEESMMSAMVRKHVPFALQTIARPLACAMLFMGPAAVGQPPIQNVGTLTCTALKAPQSGAAEVELSCNFKPQNGEARDYAGLASRGDSATFPSGKYVLVWSVLARAEAGDKPPTLEGTYRVKQGGDTPTALVGGKDTTIRLEPVAGAAQLGNSPSPTTLTLRQAATKA